MSDSNGPRTVTALWAMTAVSLAFMLLRFFCKGFYTRRIGTDDGILLLAWMFTCVYCALITISVRYGMGSHGADIHPENAVAMYEFLFLGEFMTLISIPTSKTSFAVTLLRLVSRTWQKAFIWFMIITVNVVYWTCAILLFVQCQPIQKNWNDRLEGTCWTPKIQDDFSIFAGAYSAVLDFILATFPCLIIWQLQMSVKEKLGVIFAMSLGFLAGIVAAVKTSTLPGVGKFADPTYSLADLLIWSNAETSVTIIAASIPFFRVLIKSVTNRGLSSPYQQSCRLDSYANTGTSTAGRRSRRLDDFGDGDFGHGDFGQGDRNEANNLKANAPVQGAIVKESAVTVEYHENKGIAG